jgi:hypothetical protein
MKGMKRPVMKQRRLLQMTMLAKHELMMRRAANRNAHVITPHGRIQAGRKGRRG